MEISDSNLCSSVWKMSPSPWECSPSIAVPSKIQQEVAPAGAEFVVSLTELCAQAASTLADAAQDGRLEAALREQCAKHEERTAQPTNNLDVLRETTRNLLLRAEIDGRLAAAFENMPKSGNTACSEKVNVRDRLKEVMLRATTDGRFEDAVEKARSLRGMSASLDDIRTQARDMLHSAACDGRLGWALWESRGMQNNDCEGLSAKLKDLRSRSIGDGRQLNAGIASSVAKAGLQACKLLLEAVDNQRLVGVLTEAHSKMETAQIHCRMGQKVAAAAAEDLVGFKRLKKEEYPPPLDMLTKARLAIHKASCDGRLLNALSQVSLQKRGENIEGLRVKAGQLLCQAHADGSLTTLINEASPRSVRPASFSTAQDPLTHLRETLANAAVDGRLKKALATVPQQQQHGCDTNVAAAAQLQEDRMEIARKALATTALDSRLKDIAVAMKKKHQLSSACHKQERAMILSVKQENLELLRQQSRQTLESALMDGRLEHALGLGPNNPQLVEEKMQAGSNLKAVDGRLGEALAETAPEAVAAEATAIRKQVSLALANAAVDGRLERAVVSVQERAQVRNALTGAALDGRLAQALINASNPDGRVVSRDLLAKRVEAQLETKPLQEQVRETLMGGLSSGGLARAVDKVRQEKHEAAVEQIRVHARQAILAAANDGRLETAVTQAAPAKQDVTQLRAQVEKLLTTAALDGRLAAAVAQVTCEKVATTANVRKQALEVLSNAATDGRLEAALAEIHPRRNVPASATADGRLEDTLVASQQKQQQLKERARRALEIAALDGRLHQALKSRYTEAEEEASVDLRCQLKHALSDAVFSGKFAAAITEVNKQKQNEASTKVRIQAKHALCNAAFSGKLAAALTELKQEKQNKASADMHLQAKDSLRNAAFSGKLPTALTELKQRKQNETEADVRLQAKDALYNAALSGKLEAVLTELKQQKQNEASADVRLQAKDALCDAASSGKLAAALIDAASSGKLAAALTELKQQKQDEASADIRLQAKHALCNAAFSGKLAAALTQLKQQKQDEASADIRLQAKQALCNAAFSGKLAAALTELEQQKQNEASADMRLQAKHALGNGAFSGKLTTALTELKQQKQNEASANMCLQAKHALGTAAFSGKLAAALTALEQQKQNEAAADMRLQAKLALGNAAFSGKLTATLTELEQQKQNEASVDVRLQAKHALYNAAFTGKLAAAVAEVNQQKQKERSADVLRQARSTLCDAAYSGKLAAAITEVKQTKEVQDLRLQLRNALSNTAQSGRLEEVCQQVAREKTRNHAKETLMQSLGSGGFAKAIEEVARQRVVDSEEIREVAPTREEAKSSTRRKSGRLGSCTSSHTRRRGIPSVASSTVIRLDLDEEADNTNTDPVRESSLARGYNALGVELHCMGEGELPSPKAPDPSVWKPPAFSAPSAPTVRHGSRFGALRHRAALEVASAMALDLGMEPQVSQQHSHRTQMEPKSASKGALALDLGEGTSSGVRWGAGSRMSAPKDYVRRTSSSVGAISYTRKTEAVSSKGLTLLPPVLAATKAQRPALPSLRGSSGGHDTEAAAWKMHRARSEHRWGNNLAIF